MLTAGIPLVCANWTSPMTFSSSIGLLASSSSVLAPGSGPQSHGDILWATKSTHAAASFYNCWFVINICPKASKQLEHLHGFLTAVMCRDAVMDEQSPLEVPKSWILTQ